MAQTGIQKLFVRILLFQYIILIAVFQLIDLENTSKIFKDNIIDGKQRLHIGNDYGIERMLEMDGRYSVVYKFYLIAMIVTALLSIISNMCFLKFCSGILFGLISFITYNPVLPQNKIASNNLYGIRCELIISTGILIGIILNITLPKYSEEIVVKEEDEIIVKINQKENRNDEKEIEMTTINKEKNNKKQDKKNTKKKGKKKN